MLCSIVAEKGLTLDRINVNGNYEPNNCRWITRKEQLYNKRTTILYEYKGMKKTVSQWADYVNIHRSTFNKRMKKFNNNIKLAIETPIDKSKIREKRSD